MAALVFFLIFIIMTHIDCKITNFSLYSTAHLQSKFACVWNEFEMHLEGVQDASENVSVQVQNLAIKLLQDISYCHAHFC